MKLGAYYWDGWYERISHQTERLLLEFPERMPIWGWLGDTVANMELQIDIAANAGLSFFAFDWYYSKDGGEIKMNNCVSRYLQSRNHDRMEWCLMVANHVRIYRDDWEKFCGQVLPLLKDKQALKAKGKPVIIIFEPFCLIDDLGGPEETRKCFLGLDAAAKKNGLPGICVIAAGGCGVPRDEETQAVLTSPVEWKKLCKKLEEAGYDAVSGYNSLRAYLKKGDAENLIFPFERLSADYELIWDMFAKYCKLPYMPNVNGGWDRRPWEPGKELKGGNSAPMCYSPDRTPYTQYAHVKKAGEWLKANADKALDDLAVIYAWNEMGEGGYILPTIGDNGSILAWISRAIKR